MSQSSLSSSLVTFSWNLENWKTSTWETKNLIAIKLSIVDCISHFLFEAAKIISKCYSEFWIDIILIDIRKLFNWIQINMIFERSCSVFTKKVFLKILQNSHENTLDLQLWYKRLQCRCFPVKCAKFLRTSFLQSSTW